MKKMPTHIDIVDGDLHSGARGYESHSTISSSVHRLQFNLFVTHLRYLLRL